MISYLDSNKWQAVKRSVDLLYMELCIIKKQNQVCMMLLWRNRGHYYKLKIVKILIQNLEAHLN